MSTDNPMTNSDTVPGEGHTKGPWTDGVHHRVRDGGREYAYVRGGNSIVPIAAVPLGVEGYGFEEGASNARLIAAAPDLLHALKELLAHASFVGIGSHYEAISRAAIAKAEGRSKP